MNERIENGKDWMRTGLVAAMAVTALVFGFSDGLWYAYSWLIGIAAFICLPLLGWFIGITIPVDEPDSLGWRRR